MALAWIKFSEARSVTILLLAQLHLHTCPGYQSGALSLVQSPPDTLLSLVEPYYAGAKFYAITTHLKESKMTPTRGICASQCVVMA